MLGSFPKKFHHRGVLDWFLARKIGLVRHFSGFDILRILGCLHPFDRLHRSVCWFFWAKKILCTLRSSYSPRPSKLTQNARNEISKWRNRVLEVVWWWFMAQIKAYRKLNKNESKIFEPRGRKMNHAVKHYNNFEFKEKWQKMIFLACLSE